MAPRTLIVALVAALVTLAAPASAGYWASVGGGYAYMEVEPGERGASGEIKSNKTNAFDVDYRVDCDTSTGACVANATERHFSSTTTSHADCALRVENMPGRCEVRSGPSVLLGANGTGDGRTGQGCVRVALLINLREYCGEGSLERDERGACAGGHFGGYLVTPRADRACIVAPTVGEGGFDGACASWELGRVRTCTGLVTTGACTHVLVRQGTSETRQELYCVGGLP